MASKKMLSPKDVAERMNISVSAARTRMREMPGCVNIGAGNSQILRVPESGLDAWISNRMIVIPRSNNRTLRRKNGKLVAV